MRNIITSIIAIGLVVLTTTTAAQEKLADTTEYLPVSLFAGVSGGAAFHDAEFIQLPGLPNCCEPYTGATGLSVLFDVGAEYRTAIQLFTDNLRLRLSVGAQLMPTHFRQNEVVGNIINNQTVTDGVVEHQLDLSYLGLTIQPGIILPLPSVDGLQLMIGGLVTLPITTTVEQQQVLASPTDQSYTFENGERFRARNSGPLPGATSPLLSAVAALRYAMPLSQSWQLVPMIKYQQALGSITSVTSWNVSSVHAGIEVAWQLPKPEPAMPEPPAPEPVDTIPIKIALPPVLASNVSIVSRTAGATVNGDTIFAPVITEWVADTIQSILPTLYFEYNSTNPVGGEDAIQRFAQAVKQSMVDSTDQREHVVITGSASADEDARLARERISRLLRDVPVNQNHVSVVQRKAPEARYPGLAEEDRFVRVELGSTRRMLHRFAESKQIMTEAVQLAALHTITCEAAPCVTSVNVEGGRTPKTTTTDVVIPITADVPVGSTAEQPSLVSVTLRTTDSTGNSVDAAAAMVLRRTVKETHRNRLWTDPTGVVKQRGLLLAVFDFDQTQPSSVDLHVVDSVRIALAHGRKVTLVPSTDEFGSDTYNLELRKKRAEVGRALIGKAAADLPVDLTATNPTTPHPMQRAVSRSVWVRIE